MTRRLTTRGCRALALPCWSWTLQASTRGKNVFKPGEARAVALATSTVKGQTDDAHQWMVDITLEEEK